MKNQKEESREYSNIDRLVNHLKSFPVAPNENHELGLIRMQEGDFSAGLQCFHTALESAPTVGQYWLSFISALVVSGSMEEAETVVSHALNRGLRGREINDLKRSIDAFKLDSNLRHQTESIERALTERRFEEANANLSALIKEHSSSSILLRLQARSLHAQKMYEQALAAAEAAVTANPYDVDAHLTYGNLIEEVSLHKAIDSYEIAARLAPKNAEIRLRLGDILNSLGRSEEAEKHFTKIVERGKTNLKALLGLGMSQYSQGKIEAAVRNYQTAIEHAPKNGDALALLGAAYNDLGRLDEAEEVYRKAVDVDPKSAMASSNLLFFVAYKGSQEPTKYLEEAIQWEQRVLSPKTRAAALSKKFSRNKAPHERIRIGYVSGDFRQHAVASFFESVLSHHDRSRTEVWLFSNNPYEDEVTERLKAQADHWHPIWSKSDDDVLGVIDALEIDLLIDLSGHTAYNRLGIFAKRAAPIQAHYLGYFASTGLREMDYWIADDLLIPQSHHNQYIESIHKLPRIWLSYVGSDSAPAIDCVTKDLNEIIFVSFNNISKINKETISLWARILKSIPNAKLMLKAKEFKEEENISNISHLFFEHGINFNRLQLLPPTTSWREHMELYNRADIALDPIQSHAGVTTSCEALWMGLPLITLAGDRLSQRQGVSILSAIGRSDWVATDLDAYIEKAIELAAKPQERQEWKRVQRERMRQSELGNAPALTKALEDAYFKMYDAWSAHQA